MKVWYNKIYYVNCFLGDYMKKIMFLAALFCICLMFFGCDEAVIDDDLIYTVTFHPNGGITDTTSMQTNTRGRLSNLPTADRDGYNFTGWFTTGGTQITLQTVFHFNTTVIAQWGNGQVTEPGSLSQQLDIYRDLSGSIRPASFRFDVAES
jgi:hypothetical protein